MRKILIGTLVFSVFFIIAEAKEIEPNTLTLSDMKEALYGLLVDTRNNIKQIENMNKKFEDKTKSLSSKINSLQENVANNAKQIEHNSIDIKGNAKYISVNSDNIKSLNKRNILYKKEIQEFIKNNQSLLPKISQNK